MGEIKHQKWGALCEWSFLPVFFLLFIFMHVWSLCVISRKE